MISVSAAESSDCVFATTVTGSPVELRTLASARMHRKATDWRRRDYLTAHLAQAAFDWSREIGGRDRGSTRKASRCLQKYSRAFRSIIWTVQLLNLRIRLLTQILIKTRCHVTLPALQADCLEQPTKGV
jgi:hypothetical protein